MKKLARYDFLIVGLVAFIYFLILCAKIHTNCFASGDNGDWMAGSIWWMNVQPYGSPLYILFGHLIDLIVPNQLWLGMTIGLSVIPSTITVVFTYLIVKKFTNIKIASVCSLVLMGSAVFLSQSTILEEYALATMFVTMAYYFYINNKKKLTILMLALGSAIHIIVVAISVIWLLANIRDIKQWYKTFWIYLICGILPYGLVLILMYLPTPKLLAGDLSLSGISNYLGSTGTIGSLSLFETPQRLLQFVIVMFSSLGLALIPIIVSIKGIKEYGKPLLVASVTVLFTLWLYLTDSDASTWTFTIYGMPLLMVFVGLGLQKMAQVHTKLIAVGACVLIVVNGVFLNANILSKQYPQASVYEQEIRALPDGSYIICNSGGNYGLDNYYIMASGKDIRPIFFNGDIADVNEFSPDWKTEYREYITNYLVVEHKMKLVEATAQSDALIKQKDDTKISPRYQAYLEWMNKKYGLEGDDTVEQVRTLLAKGDNVYIVTPTVTPYWEVVFYTEEYSEDLAKVTGVNDLWLK